MRLSDALESFLLQLEADGRSKHTIAQYARHVRLFASFVGDLDLHQITVGDLARFLTSPAAIEGKKPTSVNALRTSLRVFFRFQHEASLAPSNPARLLRRARCTAPPPRGFSHDETRRLLDVLARAKGACAQRDRMLVLVMLLAGIRIGSAIGLDRSDVDLDRRELVLRTTKGNAPERAMLSHELTDHLRGYLDGRSDGPLFARADGKRLCQRQAQRRVEGWMRSAGIPHGSAHSCRHAFALTLYRRTRDLALVQAAMHHRSIASTMTYARADNDEVRAALG